MTLIYIVGLRPTIIHSPCPCPWSIGASKTVTQTTFPTSNATCNANAQITNTGATQRRQQQHRHRHRPKKKTVAAAVQSQLTAPTTAQTTTKNEQTDGFCYFCVAHLHCLATHTNNTQTKCCYCY
jgi:hypothetical protein